MNNQVRLLLGTIAWHTTRTSIHKSMERGWTAGEDPNFWPAQPTTTPVHASHCHQLRLCTTAIQYLHNCTDNTAGSLQPNMLSCYLFQHTCQSSAAVQAIACCSKQPKNKHSVMQEIGNEFTSTKHVPCRLPNTARPGSRLYPLATNPHTVQ
eukprot:GHRR01009393.1.p1 GENE.GHRR01009393.1~~GHRR01009393.1.p1  ORF type:complete len:152 (+),score=17.07 GHRR01009393.1:630-1085(+)